MVEGYTLAECGISVSKVYFFKKNVLQYIYMYVYVCMYTCIWEKLLHTWNLSLYPVRVDGEHDLLEVPPELVAEGGRTACGEAQGTSPRSQPPGSCSSFEFRKKSSNCHFPKNVFLKYLIFGD